MRYIRIAVDGTITIEEREGDFASFEATRDLFGGGLIEQVRFGAPYVKPPTQYTERHMGTENALVMLVDEDGIRRGLPVNPRASMLYRCGDLHEGVIYGDAIICLSERDMIEGDEWADVPDQFAEPEFWTHATRVR